MEQPLSCSGFKEADNDDNNDNSDVLTMFFITFLFITDNFKKERQKSIVHKATPRIAASNGNVCRLSERQNQKLNLLRLFLTHRPEKWRQTDIDASSTCDTDFLGCQFDLFPYRCMCLTCGVVGIGWAWSGWVWLGKVGLIKSRVWVRLTFAIDEVWLVECCWWKLYVGSVWLGLSAMAMAMARTGGT